MNLGRGNQDDDVIRLLSQLKDSGPAYPSSLYNKRRAAVMAAYAALHLGAAVIGLSLVAQIVKMVKAMGVVEKIVLAAEVVTVTSMTTYGAIQAYVYRDQLRQLLFPTSLSSSTPFPSLSVQSPVAPLGPGLVGTPSPEVTGTPTTTAEPFPTSTSIFSQQPGNTPAAAATQAPPNQPPPPKGGCNNNGVGTNCHTPNPKAPTKTP